MTKEIQTEQKVTKATKPKGFARLEIVHDTFVPAEKGGHQKVLAGAVVDVPELDAAHLISIGKAKVP